MLVVSKIIVENPTNGQIILTEEILVNGIVVSLPENNFGALKVTHKSSIIILDAINLFPSDKCDAVNVFTLDYFDFFEIVLIAIKILLYKSLPFV